MAVNIESLQLKKVCMGLDGTEVLQACSFEFPMEKNIRIVFNSDREKFFFFNAMTQMEGFSSGEYLVNGKNVLDMSFEEFLPYRLKIGYGFSTRGLIHNRTLRQNLELPLRFHNLYVGKELSKWMDTCLDYFNFGSDIDKRPAEVSPSSQKSTLILRAFIHKPQLIFLDTPELMLSTKLQANLLQLIDDHRKKHNLRHLIFATNDEEFSDCLADQNVILAKKRLNLELLDYLSWEP